MQTLRDAFGNIVTWQSGDSTIDDIGALTASIAHEVRQPLSGIVNNANACLLMLAATPPDVDAAQEAARRTIRARASNVLGRLIVEKHHRRLWAQLNDGLGATLSFFIPRSPQSVGNGRQP